MWAVQAFLVGTILVWVILVRRLVFRRAVKKDGRAVVDGIIALVCVVVVTVVDIVVAAQRDSIVLHLARVAPERVRVCEASLCPRRVKNGDLVVVETSRFSDGTRLDAIKMDAALAGSCDSGASIDSRKSCACCRNCMPSLRKVAASRSRTTGMITRVREDAVRLRKCFKSARCGAIRPSLTKEEETHDARASAAGAG